MTSRPDDLLIPGLRPAVVRDVSLRDGGTFAQVEIDGALHEVRVAGLVPCAPGDAVLCAGDNAGQRYVIASLATPQRTAIATRDGYSARVARVDNVEVLQLVAPDGAVIIEQRGTQTVVQTAGDLVLSSSEGSVRVTARRAIELTAGEGVQMRVGASRAELCAEGLAVAAPQVKLAAARARADVREMTTHAETIDTTARTERHTVGRWELSATRVLEKARDVYREVQEQLQTKAGRIRTVAEKTYQVLAQRVLLKAHEDVKVKAEKVYLG